MIIFCVVVSNYKINTRNLILGVVNIIKTWRLLSLPILLLKIIWDALLSARHYFQRQYKDYHHCEQWKERRSYRNLNIIEFFYLIKNTIYKEMWNNFVTVAWVYSIYCQFVAYTTNFSTLAKLALGCIIPWIIKTNITSYFFTIK